MENQGFRKQPKGFATKAIHAGQSADQWNSRCVVAPIITSTTFKLEKSDEFGEFYYGRSGNPTRSVLQNCLAALDNGQFAVTYASGLGSVSAVLSLIKPGDHVITSYDIFGGTYRLLRSHSAHYGYEVDYLNGSEFYDQLKKCIKPNTKMILFESPTNPLLTLIDIQEVANIAKSYKKQEILVVVDNTFLTPYFQRPLELGADVALYSVTKYLNGHTDVVMGAITVNCPQLHTKLKFAQTGCGLVPSPFDCYQVLRSLKTLVLRMERQSATSFAIAKYLENHKLVEKVMHPALPSHPRREIAFKQSYGHSGMLAFYIKGNIKNTKKFVDSLKIINSASSLGGSETVVSLPVTNSHVSLPSEVKSKIGITENLIRMSVGLEDIDDLIEDIENGLKNSQED